MIPFPYQTGQLGRRVVPAVGGGDPNFANVSLLLHMDGTNGSTTFVDSSANGFTPTVNGNTQISTAQSKFGGSSGLFDGSGDYLAYGTDTPLVMGTGDFTVECWVYYVGISTFQRLITSTLSVFTANTFLMRLNSANVMFAYAGGAGSLTGTTAITTGVWYHVAATRESGLLRLFVDGVLQGSESSSTNLTQPIRFVGGYFSGNNSEYHNGYIEEVRITKGVARYTASFTPPTAPFPDS